MANSTYINDAIDQALLNIHTGFVAKVVSINGDTATIQPLSMSKSVSGEAQPSAVVSTCPILQSCVKLEIFTCAETGNECAKIKKVQSGDIVFCVCADRDISETRHGVMTAPRPGHHEISSAVVVGIL
jgi:hypothetical protein